MTTWSAPELAPQLARLAPYARDTFERAAALAARLHADEITPEHWLAALLEDEECAATRVVLHAFADPETIGIEVLALCPGLMLVGSNHTLPFSVRGVETLYAARAGAVARAGTRVEPGDLFRATVPHLTSDLRARLALLPAAVLELEAPPSGGGQSLPDDGPLFRHFSERSLRALGTAGRAAAALERTAIGPAHLLLGTLEVDGELREHTGLTPARVRMASSGLDEDRTPLAERRIGSDGRLSTLLAELPAGAGTGEVLGWLLGHGSQELVSLLRRQKVTSALFERCLGAYEDPPVPVPGRSGGPDAPGSSPGAGPDDRSGGDRVLDDRSELGYT